MVSVICVLFILSFVLNSCNIYENHNIKIEENRQDLFYFISSGEKTFSPDEITPSDWLNTFISEGDTSQFVLYNTYMGELNVFNIDDCVFRKKAYIPLKSMDGIVCSGENLYIQDYDSATFYKLTNLTIVDTIVPWKNQKLRIAPSRVNIFNNVYECGTSMYFISYTMGEYDDKDRNVCLEYDKVDGSVSYFVNYPDVYSKANWGGTSYRQVFTCFNSTHDKIIFSFPISHNLTVFDCGLKTVEEIYAGSSCINEIKAFSNDKQERLNSEKSYRHFVANNSYAAIIYDKYRKLYYRIFELPYINRNGDAFKKVGVVILDEQFKIVGEQVLGSFHGTTFLVIPDGILVPKIEEYPMIDAPMSYYLYKIGKK